MKFFSSIRNPEHLKNPVGKCSSDVHEYLVAPFMGQFYCEYHQPFTSITVCKSERSLAADSYGFQYELVPAIAKDIRIVCAGDFQTVICNAYRARLRGDNISEYLERFMPISDIASDIDRHQVLEAAVSLAARKDKRKDGTPSNRTQYVEARIYRPHEAHDFVNLEAGLAELLAAITIPEGDEEFSPTKAGRDEGQDTDSMTDEDFFK